MPCAALPSQEAGKQPSLATYTEQRGETGVLARAGGGVDVLCRDVTELPSQASGRGEVSSIPRLPSLTRLHHRSDAFATSHPSVASAAPTRRSPPSSSFATMARLSLSATCRHARARLSQ